VNELLIGGLLAFILVREWQFSKNTHKLIDKLMSRNYYDYEISKTVSNAPIQKTEPDLKLETIQEDLTELNSIAI
jgi:hypothetical protein